MKRPRFPKHLSRKAVVNILLAILLIDAVFLSYFRISRSLLTAQSKALDVFQPSTFHKLAAPLFKKLSLGTNPVWNGNSTLSHSIVDVPAHTVLVKDGSSGPDELYYDPRFTIAVYMNELRISGDRVMMPTLPFHWSDWADASLVGAKVGLHEGKTATCEKLAKWVHGKPDISKFCIDRDALSDEDIERLGYRNRNQLPRSIIYAHCPHENPSFNSVRSFMAKSYTMAHLPKPFKVIILNDSEMGGSFDFVVNQTHSADQRLLYSGMTERYFQHSTDTSAEELLSEGRTLRVDVKKAYNDLIREVTPRHILEEEDVMGVHETVNGLSGSNKDLYLKAEHFSYPPEIIDQQIADYEKMLHKDAMDQAYLDGLRDCAAHDGSNEPTYFKLALLDIRERKNRQKDWGWHYDWRFFDDALLYDKQGWSKSERLAKTSIILERLLRSWSRFADEKGIMSWIMHGPLLSWYWNGLMFPYDVDIDIQMPIAELVRLGKEFNQTLVVESPNEGYGRYLLDVSTYIHNRARSDTGNHIDARFIDVDTGVYIDITGLAKSTCDLPKEYKKKPGVEKENGDYDAEVYNDRRKHAYALAQVSPLHYSMLSGVPVFIPHETKERLGWEYKRGLSSYEYQDWYFVPKLQLWIPKEKLTGLFPKEDYVDESKRFSVQRMCTLVKAMTNDDGIRLLEDAEVFAEYYFTRHLTDWHMHEKEFLMREQENDENRATSNLELRQRYNRLVGMVKHNQPLRKSLFEYETYARITKD